MYFYLGLYSLLFIFHVFPFYVIFLFFSVMLYISYIHTRFHLVYCIFAIVIACYFMRSLLAFVCQEIKRLLTYLLTLCTKNNSHSAQQLYSNNNVFKCLLKSGRLMLSFRSATGREHQRRGPAAEKLLSPSGVRVLCPTYVKESANRNDRWPRDHAPSCYVVSTSNAFCRSHMWSW